MRILYHHRTLADGAEGIHIDAMVEAFRAIGHEVRVMGMAAAPDDAGPVGLVHRVRAAAPEAAVEAAAVAVNATGFWRTRRELRRFRPGLLYARHARYDVAALDAAMRAGVPSVLEVNALHSVPPYRDYEPLALLPVAARMERRALAMATVVVTVSTPLARQVEALAQRPALVVPNGADPRRFDAGRANAARARARYGIGPGPIVGWTGSLRTWHGLDALIAAIAALPEATGLVVGDGPERRTIEARAHAAGVGGRFVVTGRVPHAEMPDHLAAMDVAVVTDERTGVASPMKLLEYMAMERAVVAPDLENIRDLVQHDVSALLVPQGDTAALVAAIRALLQDPERRAHLGARARESVEQERNWRRNAQMVLQAISEGNRKQEAGNRKQGGPGIRKEESGRGAHVTVRS